MKTFTKKVFAGISLIVFSIISLILLIILQDKYKLIDIFSYLSLIFYPIVIFFLAIYENYSVNYFIFNIVANITIYLFYALLGFAGIGILRDKRWGIRLFVVLLIVNFVCFILMIIPKVHIFKL
jgi:hypothetical protein